MQAAVNFGRSVWFLAFNDIQSDYYQLPLEDKENKIAEEKIREDLKDKTIETNQSNSQADNLIEIKDEKTMIMKINLEKIIINKNTEKKLNLHSV